jgi:D-glucuronyl C5-epimerase C-terminus
MRIAALILIAATVGLTGTTAKAAERPTADGIVYRYYAGAGYRFQPLLSFGKLNERVSANDKPGARRLAAALLARGVRRGDALYWEYDFRFGGGPARWTSGFTQAVAAQAFARAGVFLGDRSYLAAGDAAFRGLRRTLLLPVGGGSWIREYGYTRQVILNAQLESILSLDSYAGIVGTPAARKVASDLEVAARTLLPRFELGCWGRYELGGAAADVHYERYHVELLRRLARTHAEPIWRTTYLRWKRCLR